MYFILLLVLCFLLFTAVVLYKGDCMCPAVVLPFTYLMCSLYGALLYNEWDAASMSYKTVLVVFVGILSFMLCGYLPWKIQRISRIHIRKRYTRINVGTIYFLLSFIICLLAVVTQYGYLKNSLSSLGFAMDSLSQMIHTMRYIKIHTNLINSDPTLIKIFRELAIGLGIFSFYIFLRNLCLYKFKPCDILHLLIWGVQIILGFLSSGGRTTLILNVVMSFYITYFYWRGFSFRQKFAFRKVKKWIAITTAIFMVTFLFLNVALGRSGSISDINVKQYFGAYIWGGTRNLDLFLSDKSGFVKQSGSETFKYLSTRLGFRDREASPHQGFSSINGYNTGNVYSSFTPFYVDLWMLGVLIFSGLQGMIFTFLYARSQRNIILNKESFVILVFAYFSNTVFYFPIGEIFYSSLITFGVTCRIIFLYFLYLIYIKKRFGKRKFYL